MRVAIGSNNPVKIKACKNVMKRIFKRVEIISVEVNSAVSHTPLTQKETIQGARERAYDAINETKADFGVGMEGGIAKISGKYFLTGWCVVLSIDGKEGIGGGSTLELPSYVVKKVRKGMELGKVIDSLAGESNTKQKYGAIGVFTKMLLNRQKVWEAILTYAMSRFISKELYEHANT